MPVFLFNRNPSTPTSVNVALPGADTSAVGEVTPGQHLAVRLRVGEMPVLYRVGALPEDYPAEFYGFLLRAVPSPVVATGRGSLVSPVVEGGGGLVPGHDTYLSVIPGHVTQDPPLAAEGYSQLRLGYAVSPSQLVLVPEMRIRY